MLLDSWFKPSIEIEIWKSHYFFSSFKFSFQKILFLILRWDQPYQRNNKFSVFKIDTSDIYCCKYHAACIHYIGKSTVQSGQR